MSSSTTALALGLSLQLFGLKVIGNHSSPASNLLIPLLTNQKALPTATLAFVHVPKTAGYDFYSAVTPTLRRLHLSFCESHTHTPASCATHHSYRLEVTTLLLRLLSHRP